MQRKDFLEMKVLAREILDLYFLLLIDYYPVYRECKTISECTYFTLYLLTEIPWDDRKENFVRRWFDIQLKRGI